MCRVHKYTALISTNPSRNASGFMAFIRLHQLVKALSSIELKRWGGVYHTSKVRTFHHLLKEEDDDEHHQKLQEDVALVGLLKSCADKKDLCNGNRLHAGTLRTGSHETSVYIGSTLVNMYAKCGALAKAQQVLVELPGSHIIAWNSLIAGYAQHELGQEALYCFEQMRLEGITPDPVTFACILKACGSTGAIAKGKEIHAEIVKQGVFEENVVLGNALVDMYAKSNVMAKAQQVFDEIPSRNVISWTALIAGYSQHGHGEQALGLFEKMQQEGLAPNAVTLACALKACGSVGATDKGKKLHLEIASKNLLRKDIVLGNALMVMYLKCGDLVRAREVFSEFCVRSVVSWTGLITGYCQYGHGEEAINCFEKMKDDGFSPNAMTFSSILKACGSVGAAEKGEEIYAEIARTEVLRNNSAVGNALVDMYAKCGKLVKAQEVFEGLLIQDVVSWTALIAGYCEQGYCEEALDCFEGMQNEGFFPDGVTFACILKACSSMGAAQKGQLYYETMSTNYGIIPTLEHHTCMMILLGREGFLDKATAVIKRMPSFNSVSAWSTLIGACQRSGNRKLGRMAFEYAVQMNEPPVVL